MPNINNKPQKEEWRDRFSRRFKEKGIISANGACLFIDTELSLQRKELVEKIDARKELAKKYPMCERGGEDTSYNKGYEAGLSDAIEVIKNEK